MESITVEALVAAIGVILALCGAVVTIGKAADTIKGWKKPQRDAEDAFSAALKRHGERLDRGERRMDKHEDELADVKEGQRALCTGVKALLEHAVHNGNTDEMQTASANIDKWLINRH